MEQIRVVQKTITPTEAKRLLEKNSHNRQLSEKWVRSYEQQMNAGQWLLTGDTIKFSPDGEVLDGQHRLTAISRGNKPIEIY